MGTWVDGVLFKGHRIDVYRVARQYRVYCDGNLFSFYKFQSAESALNEAYRKIKYIEGLSNETYRSAT